MYTKISRRGTESKASGKIVKNSDKAVYNIAKGDKKNRKNRRKESYAIYNYKVLKQVYTAAEPSRLFQYNKRLTITYWEMQALARLLFLGELAS